MNGGRLSAVEKGRQKAAEDADLRPTSLVPESEGEPRPAGDAAANWRAGGGSGVCRRLLFPPSGTGGTSEIEEAPPSPPPAPPRFPALNAEDAEAARLAAVACMKDMVEKMEAVLDRRRLRVLEQQRRESQSEGGTTDRMLALQLQAEEMQAFKEFWKPSQRNNSKRKIKWKRVISLIAFTISGLVLYISFRTRLPVIVNDMFHIVGTISVLWILGSTYSWCQQRFRTSRTISCHVPRLVYVWFWLLVLYVLYLLVLRPIHGAFAGLLGKHQ